MVSVLVDGEEHFAGQSGARSMDELIELVKASIDPDAMITGVLLSGQKLSEQDWTRPVMTMNGETLEILTGTKEEFVQQRLATAPQVVQHLIALLEETANLFEVSASFEGSEKFKQAIDEFQAFLGWFSTLFSLKPVALDGKEEQFVTIVTALTTTSEELLQQQLHQSWWAISETIRRTLIPQLREMEAYCNGLK